MHVLNDQLRTSWSTNVIFIVLAATVDIAYFVSKRGAFLAIFPANNKDRFISN
jgi:hypothetical protein